MNSRRGLDITLTRLRDRDDLARRWTALDARAESSFFLSWTWVGSWLAATGIEPLVLAASEAGETLALGLLVPGTTTRHRLLRVRQLCLTETGDPALDRLTIEHNGFLLDRAAPKDLPVVLFQWLRQNRSSLGWDELVLGGVAQPVVDAARQAGCRVELDRVSPSFQVALTGASPADSARLRQSRRFAERFGALALEPARSLDEAYRFFDDLIALHQHRWHERIGAFASPFALRFHRTLIEAGLPAGRVELLRLSAGPRRLGYLYNFVHRGTVSNYQGGFDYLDDNRHRPGLLAHALCIERAAHSGHDRYDLLAGESRYKRELAQPGETLLWGRVQAPKLGLTLERLARAIRHRVTPQGR